MESILPEVEAHPKLGHWIQEEKPGKWPPLQIRGSSEIHTTLQFCSHPFQLCLTLTARNGKFLLTHFWRRAKSPRDGFKFNCLWRTSGLSRSSLKGSKQLSIHLAAYDDPRLLRQKLLHSSISVESPWQERVVFIYAARWWWAVGMWEGRKIPLSPLSSCPQTSKHHLTPSTLTGHRTLTKWQTQPKEHN